MLRGHTSLPDGEARCRECRHSYRRGCRCDECRLKHNARMVQYAAEFKARTGRMLSHEYRHGDEGRSWIPRSVRAGIYERDGWTCWLCGEAVVVGDANADLAPSLDHVLPRSLGGDDGEANLRTAHRVCNARRGARIVEEVAHA